MRALYLGLLLLTACDSKSETAPAPPPTDEAPAPIGSAGAPAPTPAPAPAAGTFRSVVADLDVPDEVKQQAPAIALTGARVISAEPVDKRWTLGELAMHTFGAKVTACFAITPTPSSSAYELGKGVVAPMIPVMDDAFPGALSRKGGNQLDYTKGDWRMTVHASGSTVGSTCTADRELEVSFQLTTERAADPS